MRRNLRGFCVGLFLVALLQSAALWSSQLTDDIYNQGIAHYTQRNYRDAEFYLGQVLYDNPQHDQARYYLAAAMAMQGKSALALPHVQYLLRTNPQNPSYVALFDQLKKTVPLQSAAPAVTDVKKPATVEGDVSTLGVRKLSVTGGGMVPMITDGIPATPAPQLKAGYEALQQAVGSPDPQIRREAVRSLIEKKDANTIELLAWALADQPCRELAGRALMNLGDSGLGKIIDYVKNHKGGNEKKFAYALLGRSNNEKAEKLILEAWKKGETSLMETLEESLAGKGKKMIPLMLESLTAKNQNVRLSAAQILSRIGEEAIEPLIKLVKNGKTDARAEAIAVLGNLPRDTVFQKFPRELLEELRDDETAEVAAFASSMLPVASPTVDPNAPPAIIP